MWTLILLYKNNQNLDEIMEHSVIKHQYLLVLIMNTVDFI